MNASRRSRLDPRPYDPRPQRLDPRPRPPSPREEIAADRKKLHTDAPALRALLSGGCSQDAVVGSVDDARRT
jgi:hypothetical protein